MKKTLIIIGAIVIISTIAVLILKPTILSVNKSNSVDLSKEDLSSLDLNPIQGSNTICITDFSEKYYAKIAYPKDKPAVIYIFDKKGNREVLKTEADITFFDSEYTTQLASGAYKLPYDKQDKIVCDDYDFDGNKDLAIIKFVGASAYAYNLYLDKGGKLIFSPEFNEILEQYGDIFGTDPKNKEISISNKDGAARRVAATYIVENEKPILKRETKSIEDGRVRVYNTTEYKNGKATVLPADIEYIADFEEDSKILLSFTLKTSKKRVDIFSYDDDLNYALLLKDTTSAEFIYPEPINDYTTETRDNQFILNKEATQLTFTNKNVQYTIYEKLDENKVSEIGILVKMKNKEVNIIGNTNGVKGSLANIAKAKLDNLTINNAE